MKEISITLFRRETGEGALAPQLGLKDLVASRPRLQPQVWSLKVETPSHFERNHRSIYETQFCLTQAPEDPHQPRTSGSPHPGSSVHGGEMGGVELLGFLG